MGRGQISARSRCDLGHTSADLRERERGDAPRDEQVVPDLGRHGALSISQPASPLGDEVACVRRKDSRVDRWQVLSTNWSEVKEKDYENEKTAPDGQEWKKWG